MPRERERGDAAGEVAIGRSAPVPLSRRRFLASTGLLAAAAAMPGIAGFARARAGPVDEVLGPLLEEVARPLMHTLARDTIAGLVAWVVPGEDAYSDAQGATADLGGMAAEADGFLLEALDAFLPVPATYLQPLARSLLTGVADTPIPQEELEPLLAASNEVTATLDQALLALLDNDQTVPVSALIALMVNHAASMTHPAAAAGPFLSPFANLAYEEKFDAWEMIEVDTARFVATFDGDAPEPMRASLSGLVRFVAGALPEFAAFGSYTEWAVLDRDAGTATQRPVGWDMSGYLPGRSTPVDGHDELRGYYGGVRAVEGSWDRGRGAPGRGVPGRGAPGRGGAPGRATTRGRDG